MRIAFSILVILHALIHIVGFIKGFGIKEVKELSLPVSKPMGLFWLAVAVLFLTYAILQFTNYRYAWAIGLTAVILSQLLVIFFWVDAKFGTLPNCIIAVVTILSFGHYNFQKIAAQETTRILNQNKILDKTIISENDLASLPYPVKKWLSHSGAIGKPYINVGKVFQQAKLKIKPDQKNWMSATAIQYSTIATPAFIWVINVKMNSFLGFLGRDKFEDGKGEMLIKLNALVNVVNEQGEKINEGSLQRYLGEMVWFPSLALSQYIRWEPIDATTAKATMEYNGTKGSGTFYFSPDGDFSKFSALRFMGNTTDAKRHEWVLSVEGYKEFEGIRVPSKMTATWKLEDGDWTWLKLEITDLKYNENTNR